MHILISNDDGYRAPGLKVLVESLGKHDQLSVVAPERNRSGASNSLTLERPLRAHLSDNGYYFVDGTPTDCVNLVELVAAGLEHEQFRIAATEVTNELAERFSWHCSAGRIISSNNWVFARLSIQLS